MVYFPSCNPLKASELQGILVPPGQKPNVFTSQEVWLKSALISGDSSDIKEEEEEEEKTHLSRPNNSHHNPIGIYPSSRLQSNSSRTQQTWETVETAALLDRLASILVDTGHAREDRRTMRHTARTGAGISVRKLRPTDRRASRVIKERPLQ